MQGFLPLFSLAIASSGIARSVWGRVRAVDSVLVFRRASSSQVVAVTFQLMSEEKH